MCLNVIALGGQVGKVRACTWSICPCCKRRLKVVPALEKVLLAGTCTSLGWAMHGRMLAIAFLRERKVLFLFGLGIALYQAASIVHVLYAYLYT